MPMPSMFSITIHIAIVSAFPSVSSQIFTATNIMAQVEKVSHIGENPLVLSPNANKSVAKLLKENPYVAGVAVVSAIRSS